MKLYEWKISIICNGIDYSDWSLDASQKIKFKCKPKEKRVVLKDGMVYNETSIELIPSEIYIMNNNKVSLVKTRHNPSSPIKFTSKNYKYQLFNSLNNKVIDIDLVPINSVINQTINIDGEKYKVGDFVNIIGDNRLGIMPFLGCWNWNIGKPCLFCDYCARKKDEKSALPNTNNLEKSIVDWWWYKKDIIIKGITQSLKYLYNNVGNNGIKYIMIISGSLPNNKELWNIIIYMMREINLKKYFNDSIVILNVPPHNTVDELKEIKSLGVDSIQYNIEVFGEYEYQYFCPSKTEYQNLLRKLNEAVAIFGKGLIRSNIVLGLQSLEKTKKGIEEFSKIGVVIDYSIFQPKNGTKLKNLNAPTEEYIKDISFYLCDIYETYNYMPIFDQYSSRSSIMNEVFYDV